MKGILRLCAVMLFPVFVTFADDTQLIDLAQSGDSAAVRGMLRGSVDVNAAKEDGTTALHWIALYDDLDTAELLIKSGAKPDPANDYGATPLWLACTNGSEKMVSLLLEAGADPNAALWSGETPLMNCARTGAAEAVAALLDAGAYVEATETNYGQTALMWAAAGGHADITRMLIDAGADITAKTHPTPDRLPHSCNVCDWKPSPGGFTPLLFAARSGDVPTTRIFMEAGADPNEGTPEHGNSLVIAAAGGHFDQAMFLLQMGADPNSADDTGLTALHHAVGGGMALLNGVIYDGVYRIQPQNSLELARALLEAGADVNKRIAEEHLLGPDGTPFSMVGATPLLLAATSADVEMIQLLAEFGADPSLNTNAGITPLMAAAQVACTGTCAFQEGGNIADKDKVAAAYRTVKAIYELGVDVNAVNKSGQTAMHIAAFTGSEPVVQFLAEHGAEINIKDNSGETPWSKAAGLTANIGQRGLYGHHTSTADLLLKLGAREITMKELEQAADKSITQ